MIDYYIGANKDREIRAYSSSGGIFTCLARRILDANGVVFAATYDSTEYKIKHIMISDEQELAKVRKSKYVWSDFIVVESLLKEKLEHDNYVMFVGTPCQAGYIKKKYSQYEKLLIVDLFCHGTAEPKYFKEYLESLNGVVYGVDFRGASKTDESNFQFVLQIDNHFRESNYKENIFTRAYIESLAIRKACFGCKYSIVPHDSDITLGDFSWPSEAKDRGVNAKHPSIIAINTERGRRMFEIVKDDIYYTNEISEEEIAHYHRPHTYMGTWGYNLIGKESFDKDCLKVGFVKAVYKNTYHQIYELVMQANNVLNEKDKSYYLYGNGAMAKLIRLAIEDIFSELEFRGHIVTKKNNNENGCISIDEFISMGVSTLIIVAVTKRYAKDVCKELNARDIDYYVCDESIEL